MRCGFSYPHTFLFKNFISFFLRWRHLKWARKRRKSRRGTRDQKSRLESHLDAANRKCWQSKGRTGTVHVSPTVCKKVLKYHEHVAVPQQWRGAPAACRLSPLSTCPSTSADLEAAGPRTAGGEVRDDRYTRTMGIKRGRLSDKWKNWN